MLKVSIEIRRGGGVLLISTQSQGLEPFTWGPATAEHAIIDSGVAFYGFEYRPFVRPLPEPTLTTES